MLTHAVVTKSPQSRRTARIPLYDKTDHPSIILRRGFQGNCKRLSEEGQRLPVRHNTNNSIPRFNGGCSSMKAAHFSHYTKCTNFNHAVHEHILEPSKTRFGEMCGSQSLNGSLSGPSMESSPAGLSLCLLTAPGS